MEVASKARTSRRKRRHANKGVFALAYSLALIGCATPQERLSRQLDTARYTCMAAGFKDGTNELANCTMQGVQHAQADREARRQQALESLKRLTRSRRSFLRRHHGPQFVSQSATVGCASKQIGRSFWRAELRPNRRWLNAGMARLSAGRSSTSTMIRSARQRRGRDCCSELRPIYSGPILRHAPDDRQS